MINRAKCKLCEEIIEIDGKLAWQVCKCGEIRISTREERITAICKHEGNLLSVDDEGNEILVEPIDKITDEIAITERNKKEMLKVLDGWIENIEKLPPEAMSTYISHYDLLSALMIISAVFKSKD